MVTFEEFFRWMVEMGAHEDHIEAEMRAAFEVFDVDGRGRIGRDQMRYALELIGEDVTEDHINSIVEVLDKDRDGSIGFKEFVKLLY